MLQAHKSWLYLVTLALLGLLVWGGCSKLEPASPAKMLAPTQTLTQH